MLFGNLADLLGTRSSAGQLVGTVAGAVAILAGAAVAIDYARMLLLRRKMVSSLNTAPNDL